MAEISLCVPVYNSAAFLAGLFACLRALSPPPAELVFLDDASSDDSTARLRAFASTFGATTAVRVLVNEHNTGIAATYNRLAREARSEWVQLLDADDSLCGSDYFACVSPALTPDCDVVVTGLASNARLLAVAARILGVLVPHRPRAWWPLLGSFATRSGVLYRRQCLLENPFPDPAWPGSDVVHLLQLRQPRRCRFLRTPRVFYRVHAGAQSSQPRDYTAYRQQLARFGLTVRWAYRLDLALRQVGQSWLR